MDLNYEQLLDMAVKFILLPIIPLVGAYLTFFLQKQIAKLKQQTENERVNYYIDKAEEVIYTSVAVIKQTMVDNLKENNVFDEVAQKEAFERAKSRVLVLLHEESINILNDVYGDYLFWIESKIDEAVGNSK